MKFNKLVSTVTLSVITATTLFSASADASTQKPKLDPGFSVVDRTKKATKKPKLDPGFSVVKR
ncbi:hypothetical protein ACMGE5_04455 [Macrococcus equi]|uniref:hypothetical protein n=1 Tax=Macrococcus equi TaxID=3395462 RepID=UPI0039BEC40D